MFFTLLLSVLINAGSPVSPTGSALPVVLGQINGERQASGVPSLVFDPCLNALAASRAADMVSRDYFGHRTPDGQLPWDIMRTDGCSFRYAAENIAEASDSLHAVSELWQSPEHRTNTLDLHFRRIGLGVAFRPDGAEVFVEDFTD